MNSNNLPFEIKDLDSETKKSVEELAPGQRDGFVRVGPKGYILTKKYKSLAAGIYNLPLRSDDVFIVTYPRTGTTFTSEMIWLLANDLDYEKAANTPIVLRFPYLEYPMLFDTSQTKSMFDYNIKNEKNLKTLKFMMSFPSEIVDKLSSPRFIKTHLPLSLLPPSLLDSTKVVYVARDPRDIAVSYYNLHKLLKTLSYTGDFKTFWNGFIKDRCLYSPYIEHVKEAWAMKDHPNMMFLFYEELVKDLPSSIRRMASFLGKTVTDSQVDKLSKHLSIDNFKNNSSVNDTTFKTLGTVSTTATAQPFIRKGKAGGWRAHFDEEMTAQAERWIEENLRDTDLRFPTASK